MSDVGTICKPHLERTGDRVRAVRIVDGDAMCQECFAGRPIEELSEEDKKTILKLHLDRENPPLAAGTRGRHYKLDL